MELRHINFRLLQVFQQVVDHQSVSAAARALHLTQPTVSAQIKRLEEACNSKLLRQEGRRMLPTLAGEQVYRASGDVLQRMRSCSEQLSAMQKGEAGELKIALVTTAQYVLPELVARFNQRFPDIAVTLRIGNREAMLQRYFKNSDDIYIFSHPPSDTHAQAQAFMHNPLVLIAPAGHWAAKGGFDFHQLIGERFLIREPGSATRLVFDTWLAGQGLHLKHTTQIESNEAIRLSVASGQGLAVLSSHIVAHGNDPVALVDVEGFPLPSQWYIVNRDDNANRAVIDKFRDIAMTR